MFNIKECFGIEKSDRNLYKFSDGQPYLAFGGKIDPLSEIQNAGLFTSGSVFWVKAQTDSDYNTFQSQVGVQNVFTDIQSAVNKCRNDKNDYVFVCPKDSNATWTNTTNVGSAILLNKSRMHLLSVGYGRTAHGYSNTIAGPGTTQAIDTSVVKVLAPGIEVAGFKILGTAGTTANGTMTSVVSLGTASTGTAHQTWIHDTTIENTQAASGGANGTCPIVATGGTVNGYRFDNTAFVANATGAVNVSFGAGNQRPIFNDCRFVTAAQATADSIITTGTGATDYVLFKNCEFINLNSAQKNASAITGSVTTTNPVLLEYCLGVNVTAFGTDPTVLAVPIQSGTAGAGLHNPGIAIVGSAGISAA